MYKLVKNIMKKSGKSKEYDEKVIIRLTHCDLTGKGRNKLMEVLREISGDPDLLDADTISIEIPIGCFEYDSDTTFKKWDWED